MKIFTLLFALIFASPALSMTIDGAYYQRYCFTDVNICATINFLPYNGLIRVLFDEERDFMRVVGNTEVPKFYSDGVIHQKLITVGWPDAQKEQLKAETINRRLKEDLDAMAQIPDEQWNYDRDRRLCVIGGVACVMSAIGGVVSGGSAIPLAVLACSATAYTCLDAYRSYYKWQAWKRKMEEAEGIKRDSNGNVINKQGHTGPMIDVPGGSPRPSVSSGSTGASQDPSLSANPGHRDPTAGFVNPPDLPPRFGRIVSETPGTPSIPNCPRHECDPEPAKHEH